MQNERKQALNFTDVLYTGWFLALTAVILARHSRVEHWPKYVLFNIGCIAAILLLARLRDASRAWRFAHDWYPLLLFILAFEEVAPLSLMLRGTWQDAHLIALESRFFAVPPSVWLNEFASPWLTELFEIGYFGFYGMFVAVAAVLYARAHRQGESEAARREAMDTFRRLFDAAVLAYVVCYVIYIAFPTESPAHTLHPQHNLEMGGGPFHWAVLMIQRHGGVHGNAFPSGHIMLSTVATIFAFRYARQLAPWFAVLLALMCVGAVYDRYHYVSDVVAGAALGALASWIALKLTPGRPRTTNA